MKHVVLVIILIKSVLYCHSQTIEWSTTRNWKIYALNNKAAFYYPVDTLVNFRSSLMNDSLVISFLSQCVVWSKGKVATWMGFYFASFETADKKLRKIVLSSYGGFIFDPLFKRYYELPGSLKQKWNNFLIGNLQKVFEE